MDQCIGKQVLVVGLGYRTGLAVCNYLASKGIVAAASDSKSEAELAPVIEKLDTRVRLLAGNQNPSILDDGYDLIVLSPGVPKSIPLVKEAYAKGIPVISEIEFAFRRMKGDSIAITGTDGKSTTTTMVYHILKELGFDARIGGNIGIPLISFADETSDATVTAIELSSYQLETIDTFRPRVAAFLNLTPDHLDRYDSLDDYFSAKMRIAMNQTPEDWFIYNADDPMVAGAASSVRSRARSFSLTDNSANSCYVNGMISLAAYGQVADPARMKVVGLHNVQNAMAALLMVASFMESRGAAFDSAAACEALYSFQGLEHRMEVLGAFMGRIFINDSKATTVGAVEMALRSVTGHAVLILGGRAKGDDYSRLIPAMKDRVKGLVLIGETAEEFNRLFAGFTRKRAADLEEAAVKAMAMSGEGDTILLSPACASFDMFTSYEERGRAFKEAFKKISGGGMKWN